MCRGGMPIAPASCSALTVKIKGQNLRTFCQVALGKSSSHGSRRRCFLRVMTASTTEPPMPRMMNGDASEPRNENPEETRAPGFG